MEFFKNLIAIAALVAVTTFGVITPYFEGAKVEAANIIDGIIKEERSSCTHLLKIGPNSSPKSNELAQELITMILTELKSNKNVASLQKSQVATLIIDSVKTKGKPSDLNYFNSFIEEMVYTKWKPMPLPTIKMNEADAAALVEATSIIDRIIKEEKISCRRLLEITPNSSPGSNGLAEDLITMILNELKSNANIASLKASQVATLIIDSVKAKGPLDLRYCTLFIEDIVHGKWKMARMPLA